MTGVQEAIGRLGFLLYPAALAGLAFRRRLGACYAFSGYLAAVFVADVLVLLWPGRFYRWQFWIAKEAVHSVLKLAIALELAVRTFGAFPGAQAAARRLLVIVVVLTYAAVLAVPVEPEYKVLAGTVLPRILNGTIWLFTAVAGLVLWYRLPVDPLHKAILLGLVPYLLVFTMALNALDAFGWDLRDPLAYVHTGAYLALLIYWTYAAWRPQEAPSGAPVRARNLHQPV